MRIDIRADYARLIENFVSNEETRYYLKGFHVMPHPVKGAFIVATDGHLMGVFHDESAVCEIEPGQSIIVRLSKDMLKACQTPARDRRPRRLLVVADNNLAHSRAAVMAVDNDTETTEQRFAAFDSEKVEAEQRRVLIDGTFPDWQRTIPRTKMEAGRDPQAAYDTRLLARFAPVAAADEDFARSKGAAPISIYMAAYGPALLKTNRSDFFGVLMPIRADHKPGLPAWLDARPEPAPVLAEAAE